MSFIHTILAQHPAIAWAVIGVALLIVEVLLPGGFFVSFAAAGLLLALAALAGILPAQILWQVTLYFVLGVGLIPVSRILLRRFVDRTPDINEY